MNKEGSVPKTLCDESKFKQSGFVVRIVFAVEQKGTDLTVGAKMKDYLARQFSDRVYSMNVIFKSIRLPLRMMFTFTESPTK